MTIDPVVLFFILGILASITNSGLRVPKDFYDTLSIYLLLAIGIKGGVDLANVSLHVVFLPALGVIVLSTILTVIAYPILRIRGGLERHDAVSIAAHYGSVSVVTYAVAASYLQRLGVDFEQFSTVLLVLFEVMGVIAGIAISRVTNASSSLNIPKILEEVFFGKSVILLIGGLFIGMLTGLSNNTSIDLFFLDLFKGFLALFMLEMGVITSERLGDLRKLGRFLILFGIGMPLLAAVIAIPVGMLSGLSIGGITLLCTMAASASYIAAPAAMSMAEPKANPTLSMTASLGITFPFNVVIGIPIYYYLTVWITGMLG